MQITMKWNYNKR